MERTLNLHYDEVVIGADLSALSYSLVNKCPFLYIRQLKPYDYEFKDREVELHTLYNQTLFKLAFGGYCPLSDKIQSIRIEDENILKVTTKTNHLVNITFDKLKVSDDYKVEGLPEAIYKTSYENVVIDHFGIHEMAKIYPVTRINEKIIRTIIVPNKHVRKTRLMQLICKSIITDEDLKKIEYSESYIRLRMMRIYENLKELRHFKREIFSLGKNIYSSKNISTIDEDYQKILKQNHKIDEYFSFIEQRLWNKL